METFSGLAFLGALAIFVYGIRLSRIGVQLLAGNRLRRVVGLFTGNRFSALVTGALATLILQSSTATTTMLVGLASSGVVTLMQAMGVILGADIGTTIVVLLLSIRQIADFAFLILVAGLALDIFSKRKKTRYVSMVTMGFGFVFLGMRMMIETTLPLGDNHLLIEIFSLLGKNPGYAFAIAAIFTALVQNSATTLGLAIALAFAGKLNLEQAVPIILGANVGTCATSLINSVGGGVLARQVAFSHLFFKSSGAFILLFLIPETVAFLKSLGPFFPQLSLHVGPQIALGHIAFNLALSLLFLPFIRQGAWVVKRLMPPVPEAEEKVFRPKYLSEKSLESPALAFADAKREILRMGEIIYEMFRDVIVVLEKDDQHLMGKIEERDDQVDILDREIKFYLAKISQESLNSEQARLQLNLVGITSDLEDIGDLINKSLLELARKKIEKVRRFSREGWEEIRDVHGKVLENFQLTISTLTTEDESLARKVSRHEHHLAEVESRYREAHLQRLHKGLKETFETSSIHLDLLAGFRMINTKLMMIVKETLPEAKL